MPETLRPIDDEYLTEAREPVSFRRPDGEIAEEIRCVLADDVGLDARAIHVAVRAGQVTLSGIVRTCADMRRAEAHACAVSGAASVQNDLQSKEKSEDCGDESEAGSAAKMGKPEYDR